MAEEVLGKGFKTPKDLTGALARWQQASAVQAQKVHSISDGTVTQLLLEFSANDGTLTMCPSVPLSALHRTLLKSNFMDVWRQEQALSFSGTGQVSEATKVAEKHQFIELLTSMSNTELIRLCQDLRGAKLVMRAKHSVNPLQDRKMLARALQSTII
jgi:hypothetical protein